MQRVLTQKQLGRFNGVGPPKHSKRIYLAILGSVFDVTEGAQHYGESAAMPATSGRRLSGWHSPEQRSSGCTHGTSNGSNEFYKQSACGAGAQGNYHGAAGRDSSKAFITGTLPVAVSLLWKI